jgi:hypothetical protein
VAKPVAASDRQQEEPPPSPGKLGFRQPSRSITSMRANFFLLGSILATL